ncbi:MAG: DEAD/DEAH box helicase [Ignisphaera sp.]
MSTNLEKLPKLIEQGFIERGITKFTPPQLEALDRGLLNGENIVVVAPTASGKTLIGEIALLNAYLNNKKGIYTTPLKALAYEKYEEFKFWEKYGVKVGISVGDYVVTEEEVENLEVFNIIITTYERLDSILRKRPKWINKVGVIVIDELHMLGDESRGHIVEMIAIRAKLLGIQIVGLSATIGNPEEVANWLNAKLVKSNWRPVKLYEIHTYKSGRSWVLLLPRELSSMGTQTTIHVEDLTEYWILKAINEGFNVLEFKYSRKAVEELAYTYAPIVCRNLPKENKEELNLLLKKLKEELHDFEYEKLHPLIQCGVSYHHAGLSYDARRFIERTFKDRLIKYLAATPTLAMGVNLPARVVIINTKYFSGGSTKRISVLEYKQLSGRAGRPQYDPYGIVVVAKDVAKLSEAKAYTDGIPEGIKSTLLEENALRRHVLSVIASGEASTFKNLVEFFSASFGATKISKDIVEEKIRRTTLLLEELVMIKSVKKGNIYNTVFSPTKLGLVTSWLYVDPITSFTIIDGLVNKDRVSELYYLSLIGMTPDFSDIHINKNVYEWFEDYILDLEANDEVPPQNIQYYIHNSDVDWLRGCIIGLILRDWIEEVPERTIVERYGIELGDLTVIRDTAEWLLYAAHVVTKTVSLENHSKNLEILLERVRHGVKEDALELVNLRYIGRVRARILLQHGIKSIKDVVLHQNLIMNILGEGWGRKVIEEAVKMLNT